MKLTERELVALHGSPPGRPARGRPGCLTGEQLVAAASGEAEAAERESAAEHLAGCAECAEEYQLLLELRPWAARSAAALVPAARARRAPARWYGALSAPQVSYALAASLALLCLGLAGWGVSLRRENQQLAGSRERLQQSEQRLAEAEARGAELGRAAASRSGPALNVHIADLEPGRLRGSAGEAVKSLEVPRGASQLVLILHTPDRRVHPGYALEVADASGSVVWLGEGLERSSEGAFTVAFPRSRLAAGDYRFRLYGLGGSTRTLIQEYAARLRYR